MGAVPSEESSQPLRTVIGDIVRRFLRATKPPEHYGAGLGASIQRAARIVLWVNLQLAAAFGFTLLYGLRNAMTASRIAGSAFSIALLAILMVLGKALYGLLLMPFRHVALTVVAAGVAIEALLAGRLFTQLAYREDIDGIGGLVLKYTDPLVSPFESFEGSPVLHDTGVIEFATLTAMEAYLVATIAIVLALTFWSEFLHMYRRVRDFFAGRAARNQRQSQPEPEEPAPLAVEAAAADLSTAT